jgi:hypothetical protein
MFPEDKKYREDFSVILKERDYVGDIDTYGDNIKFGT